MFAKLIQKGKYGAAWLTTGKVKGLDGSGAAVANKEIETDDPEIIEMLKKKSAFKVYDTSEGDEVIKQKGGPIKTSADDDLIDAECARCGKQFKAKNAAIITCPVCALGKKEPRGIDLNATVSGEDKETKIDPPADVDDEICEVCESVFVKNEGNPDQTVCAPCQEAKDKLENADASTRSIE